MRHDVPLSTLIASARDIMATHAYQTRYIASGPDGRPCSPCRERVALSFHGAVIRACYGVPGQRDAEVFAFLRERNMIPVRRTVSKSDCLAILDLAFQIAKDVEANDDNPMVPRAA